MLGDNIRKIRIKNNMTQKELAEIVGVTPQTVSSWEVNRTEPNMGAIELLASALNCRKSDLIGESVANRRKLSYEEMQLIQAYRRASDDIKNAALRVLGVEIK